MIWTIIMIISLIIAFILDYAYAKAIYEIACVKGADNRKYFWWTFIMPLFGALMVIALPDRRKEFRNLK